MKRSFKLLTLLLIILPFYTQAAEKTNISVPDVMTDRLQQEKAGHNNAFLISLYRPTYVLPLSYDTKPFQEIYLNNTPQNQPINHAEVKFQISFKIPVWLNLFNNPKSSLYVAYTQQSYWQAYNHSAFFRETNYEPELFIANHVDKKLFNDWKLSFLNLGAAHQSNGKGGIMERSWNRVYGEAILSNRNWMFSFKPWIVVRDNSYKRYNADLGRYLGYERILTSYKYHDHVFSLEARNTFESGFRRGAVQASWSFPLRTHLRGYVEAFSGYGQSLIEYDHFTNNLGIGIALNDWI